MKVMRQNRFFIYSVITLISACSLISCTSKQKYDDLRQEYNQLKVFNKSLIDENDSLKKEIEKYETTPDQLMGKASGYIAAKDTVNLEILLQQIIKYHPRSSERKEIEQHIKRIKDECYRKRIEEKNKRLAAVKKLKKEYDDVSGITWYYNPYFVHYYSKNLVSLYIGQIGNSVWLRLKMTYHGDNWIFFKNAYLSYDGNTYDIYFDEYQDKETDVGYGVSEWIDVSVSSSTLDFLKQMVNGKHIKMRLSGKYTRTRDLSTDEIKGIRDVLLAYDVLVNENKKLLY